MPDRSPPSPSFRACATARQAARRRLLLALAATPLAGAASVARAEPNAAPAGPIRLVAGFRAGGASDFGARALAEKLARLLGIEVSVVNRPGDQLSNEGENAAKEVAEAPPDGRTLLVGTLSTMVLAPIAHPDLVPDPAAFVPVSLVAVIPLVLAVHPGVPVRNVSDFIQYARALNGRVALGISGGTSLFAAAEFGRMTATQFQFVRYGANGPQLTGDLVAGRRIQAAFDNLLLPEVQAGRLRALAVSTQMRLSALPEVPTLSEAGLPGYDIGSWLALFAPAGTPRGTAEAMARDVERAMADRATMQAFAAKGFVVRTASPEQLATMVRAERTRHQRATTLLGVSVVDAGELVPSTSGAPRPPGPPPPPR